MAILTPQLARKLLRFGLTGAFVTGVHYAVVVVMMDAAGANQVLANAVAFVIANVVSFFINARVVFRAAGTRSEFAKFFTVSLAGFLLTLLVSSLGQHWGWHRALTVVVLSGFLALLSFAGHQLWTFRQKT